MPEAGGAIDAVRKMIGDIKFSCMNYKEIKKLTSIRNATMDDQLKFLDDLETTLRSLESQR